MSLSPLIFLVATTVATVSPPVSDNPLDKVRCVREQITGSLASTRKVCHTEREWRRIHDDAEDEARRLLQPGWMSDGKG